MVAIVAVSLAVIVVSLQRDEPTTTVPRTTGDTTTTTTTVAPTTSGLDTTTTVPPEVDETEVTLRHGGRDRGYLVVTPRGIDSGERLPTVVVLHGLGVNARAMSRTAEWRRAVERERFVAVFPQGVADSWNMGPCCAPANLIGTDDVGFLDTVVDELVERPDVDADRMYLTGFSNGGVMTYAFACARPGRFAAIAPMAGSNLTGCFPDPPVSLLHQHSDPDPVVPYHGGLSVGRLVSAADFPDVPESVADWAARAGCDSEPAERTDDDQVQHLRWHGCDGGVEVRLVRVPGRGHAWPNRGDYDPLEELLDFFGIT